MRWYRLSLLFPVAQQPSETVGRVIVEISTE